MTASRDSSGPPWSAPRTDNREPPATAAPGTTTGQADTRAETHPQRGAGASRRTPYPTQPRRPAPHGTPREAQHPRPLGNVALPRRGNRLAQPVSQITARRKKTPHPRHFTDADSPLSTRNLYRAIPFPWCIPEILLSQIKISEHGVVILDNRKLNPLPATIPPALA